MSLSGRFTPPPRQTVIYGVPVAQALEAELTRLQAKRVVFVTNTSLAQPGGLADKVIAALGPRAIARVTDVASPKAEWRQTSNNSKQPNSHQKQGRTV